jgi:predicted ester cyclase
MTTTGTELTRRLFDEVFNRRDLAVVDDLVAADFVEHAVAPFATEPPGRVAGPAHMRGVVEWLTDQYPDLTMTVEAVVTEGDTTAVRVRSEGTNLGRLNGVMPPTGEHFTAEQSHWYRVDGDRLVEHWATRDDLSAMVQLGVIPRPGPPGG